MASDESHAPTVPRTAAVILAGGGALRMGGTDKTRLPLAGTPTIERVLRAAPVDQRIVVGPAGSDGAGLASRYDATFVREDPPGSGPVAAVARGIAELTDDAPDDAAQDDDRILILGGDMPLLRRDTLASLLAARDSEADDGVAAPRTPAVHALADHDGHVQFLCAAWPLPLLRRALASIEHPGGGWADLSLRRLYAQLAPDEIVTRPASGSEIRDIDTPDDLDAASRAAGPRVALAQIVVPEDPAATEPAVRAAVARAAESGADLVVLPEATIAPFGTDLRAAAARHDEFEQLIARLAAEHDLAIAAGSFTPAADGRVRNTLIVRGRGIRADYDKLHLYDAFGTRESDTVAPGERLVTIDLLGARLGLATCYDLRFPEQFTALARRGAHAAIVPVAWGDGPGKAEQLGLLLRARALDATVAILAADQAPPPGYDGRAPRGVGRSAAVGPLGAVREELGRDEGMIIIDLDLAEIAQVRERLPVLDHAVPLPADDAAAPHPGPDGAGVGDRP